MSCNCLSTGKCEQSLHNYGLLYFYRYSDMKNSVKAVKQLAMGKKLFLSITH